ncbi:exodeoxyribonuclease V subunit alpha [Xanthomonas citri]|uniref:exodeoxyribonuclease V subunit alpha n=2 Tax=Xanthomonas citri TaxID=346 RepID=UPI0015838E25|nr:exodeoxyribonuclease V subunit alpha [Xanthomonas citri]MDS0759680.1 exodeoxyribonuclease V subunit alpha [Xanthomonas citri pv. punicae]MDS0763456.1 exodeoxyribonuclease V subunit alpha [Xanthomonas citri pv. punicae]MDS0798227.1 exodeoxyribonuclease V subunit alpha [Xanthomonas citri pv. punicae]MDS0838688.1 exodeoxyribonuclease V subunit alpha [Xanthomonas citri pv. punicae]MDS0842472.1 exodeoxyribonuclease V subunit alpha [Xanthomonas citri pv. punicae]
MSLLADLQAKNHLRTLDHAFAQSLRRLRPDTPDTVLLAAALSSLAVANGHAGLDPRRPRLLVDADVAWPAADAWMAQLQASPWIAQPDDPLAAAVSDAPLVLEHGLLYLRRYREYEARLAAGLTRIASHTLPATESAALAAVFAALFPSATTGQDRQAQAAALALRRALLLITGGPGTGKTTTIARLLLLRLAQAHAAGQPPPRIALAAPTGRAAERMAESLRIALARAIEQGLPAEHQGASPLPPAGEGARRAGEGTAPTDFSWHSALPTGASTLHRLLGVIPDSPHFRHDADNPLPFDLIVVDEASMVDLPLMCKLVQAVADGTQLILLGDADQLPSVEAGDVLAAILQAAGPADTLPPDDARALQPLLGSAPVTAPAASTPVGHLAGHRVHLLRGYRQAADFALAPLADAVRIGDADTALSLLRSGTLPGVHFHEDGDDPLSLGRDALLAHWHALTATNDPADALRQAGRLRLLTAVRAGPQGARGLNARIEQLLAESGSGARRLGAASPWFHGRLLLITENSYRHGLFNGDVGICLRSEASPASAREPQAALVAWFDGDGDGQVRGFHPAALPAHESAFAMTVHKAQGSEFDEVWLQLPTRDARVLSRELLYTGITRARRALHLAGSEAVIRSALARHAARISGLAWRLGAEQMQPTADAASPLRATTPTALGNPIQGSLF